MGRPILLMIFIGLISLLTHWFIVPFLNQFDWLLLLILFVLIAIWATFTATMRKATVQVHKKHIVIQGPWNRFPISYRNIRGVIPIRLSDQYTAGNIRENELNWLHTLYEKPCAFIQTHKSINEYQARYFDFHRLLFPQSDRGVICIVDDWVTLADQIEKQKSIWIREQTDLPKQQSTNRTTPSPQSDTGSDAPRILVVTYPANQQVRFTKNFFFRYQLEFASNGTEALQKIRESNPHIVLTYANLPKMDGVQLLKAIRKNEHTEQIPVFVLCQQDSPQVAAEAFAAGANDVITEPFTDSDLPQRVEFWLEYGRKLHSLTKQNYLLRNKTLSQTAELIRRGELINFLPQTVAQNLMNGQIDSENQPLKRLNTTVLFIDIVGFTSLTAELDPAVLAEILNEYLREMTAVAITFNGTVDKFIGDAVMVLFGAPNEQNIEDQVWNAAQTAFEMRRQVETMNMIWRSRLPRDLEVRIGFNTGECTAGVFGNDLLRSYTVIGRGVNIAARLQSAGKPGQIVCSADSYAYLQNQVVGRPLGLLTLKGVPHPVDAYTLEKIKPQNR